MPGRNDGHAASLCFQEGNGRAFLVAIGSGWHLEEPIAIPPLGDPEPVCLNPPCRSNPPAIQDAFSVY